MTKNDQVFEQGAVISGGSSVCGDSRSTFFTILNPEINCWVKNNMEGKLPTRPTKVTPKC